MKNLFIILALLVAITGPALAAEPAGDATLSGSFLSGQFARSSGDVDDAIRYLKRTHEAQPKNNDITSELIGALMLQGKVEDATALAAELRQAGGKDPIANLLLALKSIKAGQPAQASAILDSNFDAGSGQLWLPLITGWLDAEQHKLLKPLTVEGLSSNVGHASGLVNYHLALINNYAGFKDAAADNFLNAVEDPQNPPARVMAMLLQFYEQNGRPAQLKPLVEAYHASHAAPSMEEDTPVIANLQDGVAEVLFTMGSVMLGAGATQDSVLYLQLALYLKPDLTVATLALADAYGDLHQYARSNEVYGHIPPESRIYDKAQLEIALNYDRMGKLDEALALLDHLSKQLPDDVDVWVGKGDLLRIHARYREAIEAYTQALAHVPEMSARYWPVLFARGASYERDNQWPQAERDLKQVLDLKPSQPETLNYLAYGWLSRGEHVEEARGMLQKALKIRPNDPQIIDSMGWALYLSGDVPGATDYLEKAVELLPGDATVNDHLGDAYWQAGRKTEARYQWERSLSFTPEPALEEELHKKLKSGLPPLKLAGDATAKPLASGDAATE